MEARSTLSQEQNPKTARLLIFAAALLALSPLAAPGATITFSGLNPLASHYLDGSVSPIPNDSSFSFQLGAFTTDASFAGPTDKNTHLWAAHWTPVTDGDSGLPQPAATTAFTTYPTIFGPTDGFTSDVTLNHNNSPFTGVDQGYIWGYNTKDLGTGSAQWILMTNAFWTFPFGGNPPPANETWSTGVADPAATVVGSLDLNGGMTLQLMAVPAVPEPAATALLLLGASGALLRRRRSS